MTIHEAASIMSLVLGVNLIADYDGVGDYIGAGLLGLFVWLVWLKADQR
jgi:hypothetical protein